MGPKLAKPKTTVGPARVKSVTQLVETLKKQIVMPFQVTPKRQINGWRPFLNPTERSQIAANMAMKMMGEWVAIQATLEQSFDKGDWMSELTREGLWQIKSCQRMKMSNKA